MLLVSYIVVLVKQSLSAVSQPQNSQWAPPPLLKNDSYLQTVTVLSTCNRSSSSRKCSFGLLEINRRRQQYLHVLGMEQAAIGMWEDSDVKLRLSKGGLIWLEKRLIPVEMQRMLKQMLYLRRETRALNRKREGCWSYFCLWRQRTQWVRWRKILLKMARMLKARKDWKGNAWPNLDKRRR